MNEFITPGNVLVNAFVVITALIGFLIIALGIYTGFKDTNMCTSGLRVGFNKGDRVSVIVPEGTDYATRYGTVEMEYVDNHTVFVLLDDDLEAKEIRVDEVKLLKNF